MVYAYLGKNSIKVLSLTKTLLGQFNISHFSKTHSNDFLANGTLKGMDLAASALKEAITSAQPQPITDKDVTLILPQDVFTFGRYTIPSDISDTAIEPFLKDKVRNDLKISLTSTYHDYIVQKKGDESVVLFYALDETKIDSFSQVLELVQLRLAKILPETFAYFTLFEKTLRKDKKGNILYASYNEDISSAYLFDSFGLLESQKYYLEDDVKASLKEIVQKFEKENGKMNRLILSGTQSKGVRQDLFTKDVGTWTNPLEKIIENFYQDYLKVIVPDESKSFSVLEYDVNLGAFIFAEEHKDFDVTNQSLAESSGRKMPKVSLGLPGGGILKEIFNVRTVVIFVVSFLLSFGIIYGFSQMQNGGFSFNLPSVGQLSNVTEEPTPTPTPEPTATPTPTPSITRDELTVKILNGTGTAGQAGDVQDILEEAGYTDIVTDNADSFDNATTDIQINEDAEGAFSLIREDLADFVSITEAAETPEDENADIVIITGEDLDL